LREFLKKFGVTSSSTRCTILPSRKIILCTSQSEKIIDPLRSVGRTKRPIGLSQLA
jgi:hypothetical protein